VILKHEPLAGIYLKPSEAESCSRRTQERKWKMADKTQMVLSKIEAGKPVRPGDIAKMTGLDKDDVSKILSELKKGGKITSPKRCFYDPTD